MDTPLLKILALNVESADLCLLQNAVHGTAQEVVLLIGESSDEGIQQAQQVDPDVIVVNIAEDWEACCHLCRRLKSSGRLATVPVLVMGRPQTNTAVRTAVLNAGADGFLSPQFDAPELIAQVRAMAKIKATNRFSTAQANTEALEQILNMVPQAVFWKDRSGHYLGCNRVFAQMAGYTDPMEIIGKTDFDLPWARDGAPRFTADDRQVMESHRPKMHILEPLLAADGSQHWLDTSKVPLADETGKVYAVLGVFEDITERRWVTYALDKFFDQPTNLHLIAQLDSTIVRTNRGWEYVLGYTDEELAGASFMDLIHPDDHAATLDEMSKLGRGETIFYFENRYRHKDGSYRVLAWSALASVEEQMVFAVATDITKRRQAEVALQESEARYRSLLEQAPIGIAVHIDEKIVFVNPAGAELLGASSAAQLIGLPITQFVHSQSHTLLQARRDQWYTDRDSMRPIEYVLVRLDGEAIDVEVTSATFTFQGQAATQIIVRDITAQKRSEAERSRLLAQVQAQAQQISQILDTVPEGVLLLDRDARVVMTNPSAVQDLRRLAGVGVGEVVSFLGDVPIAELLTSRHKGPWHEIHAGQLTYEATARPLAVAQIEPGSGHWVIVLKDVTQERVLGLQLQQQERLAAVGQLAAGIAHDFNNILAILSLHGTLAAQTADLPARVGERLTVINDQTTQATRLVQQILDFSRRAVLDRRPLDLKALLEDQVQLLARTLPENIILSLNAAPGDYVVMADPTRIQQMVMNLVFNARDAMPQGGSLHLTLTQDIKSDIDQSDAPRIRLSIADSGTGMSAEIMARLFEPFFTTKPRGRGTGLGLAQVYGIVKQHEGEISVESRLGQGTTVSIFLPTAVQIQESDTVFTADLPSGIEATILLVEDNVLLLDAMSDTLMLLGYTVLCAGNGREALAVLEKQSTVVDLVLTDLTMPQMGGDALLQTMRMRGYSTPVVILSGHPLAGELEALKSFGLGGWLLKPPNIQELSQLITQVLTQ